MKMIVYVTFLLMLVMWKPERTGNGQTVPAVEMIIPDPIPDSSEKDEEIQHLMEVNKDLDSALIQKAQKKPEVVVKTKVRVVEKPVEAVVYLRHQDGTLERRVIEPGNAPVIDLVVVRDTVYVDNPEPEKKGWLRKIF